MAPSYTQNTAKSCQIRTTVNLPFKRPLHAKYRVIFNIGALHKPWHWEGERWSIVLYNGGEVTTLQHHEALMDRGLAPCRMPCGGWHFVDHTIATEDQFAFAFGLFIYPRDLRQIQYVKFSISIFERC